MARRYWLIVDGRRLHYDTLGAAQRAAQGFANRLGRAIQGGYDDLPTRAKPKKRTPARPSGRTYAMNPLMGGHNFTGEEWKISARGRHGQRASIYCDSEREARNEVRILRGLGYQVTHVVRLRAPAGA